MVENFAIIGGAGYIAPRHLKAIADTGNRLVAATDPSDSVGILDGYGLDIAYFREFERFDRHIEKLRRGPEGHRIHYVSICSPNYLHDAHIRFALRTDCDAICEKPLVLNPWNCDALLSEEERFQRRVYVVLQLRLHPAVQALRNRIQREPPAVKHKVDLRYITPRGMWYQYSWKGDPEKSGGLATNIGVHFFDLLIWVFGAVVSYEVNVSQPRCVSGHLELERAEVSWLLSTDPADLPSEQKERGDLGAHRALEVDGETVDFSQGFTDLHTAVYADVLSGGGFGVLDAMPSIQLVHDIRSASVR